MNFRLLALLSLLAAPVVCIPQETDAEFEALVDELLDVTGALEIGEQFSQLITTQMFEALRATDSTIPDSTFEVIEDEVGLVISESLRSRSFQKLFYPIYARHLSKSDMQAMVDFYNTPEGKRIAAVLPVLTQEGMLVGQTWGESLGPEIGRRVVERLKAEGIQAAQAEK